jgi:L-lysine exporter family protein LysE/ArgO
MTHHIGAEMGLIPTLMITAMLTFCNPHVYLDTVVLIGALSLKFEATDRVYYGLGASISSFVFFFSLAYGAKYLARHMERPNAWRIMDACIATIMFALALSMLQAGGLI